MTPELLQDVAIGALTVSSVAVGYLARVYHVLERERRGRKAWQQRVLQADNGLRPAIGEPADPGEAAPAGRTVEAQPGVRSPGQLKLSSPAAASPRPPAITYSSRRA